MAEVKWVKLTTDMFDNRKVKHLRKLPEGNNIVLIWVMLLTMAGRCNSGGMIFLTENIPYTPKMLAEELDFEENTVLLALQALENLDMIVTENGFFAIAGWEEYQNIEGMEKIREQNRLRKQRQRQKQALLDVSRDVTGQVTECHATDIELDKEKDKEIDFYTTTTTTAEPPSLTDVYIYFKGFIENAVKEAEKFHAYNANKGWTCLPNWKATADLWIARIHEKG
jgi:predicted phage replisome organizer